MTNVTRQSIAALDEHDLRRVLRNLAQDGRTHVVQVLLHLAELDGRGSFVSWGYGSLWDYCGRELELSAGTSARFIASSRGLAKWPQVEPYLTDGRLNVCNFSIIAAVLTPENVAETLDRAVGMTRRQAQDLVVAMGAVPAQPQRRDSVKLVARLTATPKPAAAASGALLSDVQGSDAQDTETATDKPGELTFVEVHRVAFDAGKDVVDNLKRLQELLGHADLNEVVRRASESLLDRVDPVRRHARREKKKGRQAVSVVAHKSSKASAAAGTDDGKGPSVVTHRQPLAVRDAVHVRDESQCTFRSKDGVRCVERGYLHIDHVKPFALGGSSIDIANAQLLCAAHNLLRAEMTYGKEMVQRAMAAQRTC